MKITKVEAYPVWDGHRNFLFVVVDTSEGISGIGEAGITGRELAVMGAIEHFTPLLIGQNPARIEYLWQLLFRGGFFSRSGCDECGNFRHRYRPVGHQRQNAWRTDL